MEKLQDDTDGMVSKTGPWQLHKNVLLDSSGRDGSRLNMPRHARVQRHSLAVRRFGSEVNTCPSRGLLTKGRHERVTTNFVLELAPRWGLEKTHNRTKTLTEPARKRPTARRRRQDTDREVRSTILTKSTAGASPGHDRPPTAEPTDLPIGPTATAASRLAYTWSGRSSEGGGHRKIARRVSLA